MDHSFLYKEFLDEEHFKSKLKEQFTLASQGGDLKVTTKIKGVVDTPIMNYDNSSGSSLSSRASKRGQNVKFTEHSAISSRIPSRNSSQSQLKSAAEMIMSPRSSKIKYDTLDKK